MCAFKHYAFWAGFRSDNHSPAIHTAPAEPATAMRDDITVYTLVKEQQFAQSALTTRETDRLSSPAVAWTGKEQLTGDYTERAESRYTDGQTAEIYWKDTAEEGLLCGAVADDSRASLALYGFHSRRRATLPAD